VAAYVSQCRVAKHHCPITLCVLYLIMIIIMLQFLCIVCIMICNTMRLCVVGYDANGYRKEGWVSWKPGVSQEEGE